MKFQTILLAKGVEKTKSGFSGEGPWLVLKCFYDKDDDYGEFYFNLNTENGEAEIAMKDRDYAPVLLDALEKELKDKGRE